MFLLTKVNDLLKSVSAFGADKVVPHSEPRHPDSVGDMCTHIGRR